MTDRGCQGCLAAGGPRWGAGVVPPVGRGWECRGSSRSPRKIVRGDVVVTSSISLASSLRIAYPSKTPPAPSSSFHRSSSSRCKHFVGLRREPFPCGHRLTHSAAPPLPTANAPLTLRREPYISPRDPLETTKGGGAVAPRLWNPTPGGDEGRGRAAPSGRPYGGIGRGSKPGETGGGGAPPLHGHRKFLRRADVGIGPYGGDGGQIAASACGLLAMTGVFCHSEERSDVGIRFLPSRVQFPTR